MVLMKIAFSVCSLGQVVGKFEVMIQFLFDKNRKMAKTCKFPKKSLIREKIEEKYSINNKIDIHAQDRLISKSVQEFNGQRTLPECFGEV